MVLFYLAILILTAVLSWWISGYDPDLTGNKEVDVGRRMLRCGLTLFLMAGGLVGTASDPRIGGVIAITIAVPMVKLWLNCVGEAASQGFCHLIDSPSDPESNPEQLTADLDRLALLSNRGQFNEALQLCGELLEKGDASRMALETMCFRLYSQMFARESFVASPSLSPINELCESGQIAEAESQLNQLLEREPENLFAVFLLAWVYLQQPEKVRAVIQSVKKKSKLPPLFAEYIDYQIKEWLGSCSSDAENEEGIESLLVGRRIAKPTTELRLLR
jgi:hypothetical protein